MYIFVIILPLIGFIQSAMLGRYYGRLGASYLTILGLFLSNIIAWLCFLEVSIHGSVLSEKLYS